MLEYTKVYQIIIFHLRLEKLPKLITLIWECREDNVGSSAKKDKNQYYYQYIHIPNLIRAELTVCYTRVCFSTSGSMFNIVVVDLHERNKKTLVNVARVWVTGSTFLKNLKFDDLSKVMKFLYIFLTGK